MNEYLADNLNLIGVVVLFLAGAITFRFFLFGGVIDVERLFDGMIVGIIAGLTSALVAKNLFAKKEMPKGK